MTARLQIQFLGLNEGGDPKNLPPGTMLRAENVQMDKERRLHKRRGLQGLSKTATSGSNIASGKRLLSSGDDLSVTDGETLWTYAEALAKWVPVDRPPSWGVTKRPLVDTTRSTTGADIAISGDLLVTLYVSAGIFVKVESVSTGAVVFPPTAVVTPVSTDCYPRVLISGGVAYLFSSTGTAVQVAKLNLTTLALTTSVNLFTNATALHPVFDAVIGTPTAGVPTLYVAYELAAGTNRTRIASFTLSTLAAVATLDSLGTGLTCACIVFSTTAQRIGLIYSSRTSTSTKISTCTTALASQVGPTQVEASIADSAFIVEFDASYWFIGWTRNSLAGDGSDADRLKTLKYGMASHTMDATIRKTTYGVTSITKPWNTGGRWFIAAAIWVHTDALPALQPVAQPSTVVLELETTASLSGALDSTHPHVATLENYTGWFSTDPYNSARGGQSQTALDGDGNVWVPAAYRDREPIGYTLELAVPTGWNVFRLAASGGDTFATASLGLSTLIAGGAPAWNDGAHVMPYGFAHQPVILGAVATAGGAMVAGSYSYVATYAWRDARGVLHRSAPSAPLLGTTAGGNLSLTVTITTSSVSAKLRDLTYLTSPNPVYVELWRTTIGGTSNHYRLTLEPTYQVIVNDARTNYVVIVDTKADANIASGTPATPLSGQAQLPTDLGELENVPPPALDPVATHRGRLVGIGPDRRTLCFSKDSTIDPTIAPGFNEALTLAFSSDKMAVARLDTALVVFGEDTIDVVQGDGPDDTGSNNTWQIQGVQTDVGCVNSRSVVTSPMGVMFESRRGIELLDRGLGVSAVLGRFVMDSLTAYPTITSAVLVAELNEVRFTCDNGTTGIVLAYDYLNKIWFTRKYTDASDTAVASVRFVDAAIIGGVYTLLTASGQVYRETEDSSLDGGSAYVETDILLAPISAQPGRSGWSNDNLAWQRAKDLTVMGTSVANHDLSVSFALDYSATFGQTHRFLSNATGTPTAVGPLEKAKVTLATQKCQAVQIRIRDLTPTGSAVANTSAGLILESLCLRVGAKDGPAKTSAGQQA